MRAVVDCRVNVTFVNYAGERTRLPGLAGETLMETARRYNYHYLDGMSVA